MLRHCNCYVMLLYFELFSIDMYYIIFLSTAEGTIFGVSLSTLVDRDEVVANRRVEVPLIVQKVLGQLEKRGLGEQGLLRMAAPKAKVDKLCAAVEKFFYAKHEEVDQMLEKYSVHDLVALLKRLLRDLPGLLLTHELVNLFYQSYCKYYLSNYLFSDCNNLFLFL